MDHLPISAPDQDEAALLETKKAIIAAAWRRALAGDREAFDALKVLGPTDA